MISRHWTGLVKKGREDEYIAHLQNDTFKKLFEIDGFTNATILKRDFENGIEFLIITEWDSLETIKKFAGENYEVAVVPQIAKEMMIHYDDLAKHYEVKFKTK